MIRRKDFVVGTVCRLCVQNADQHETKATVDQFVGVGDEQQAQTESEAYRLAH
jgi:hypothetical protein